MPGIFCPKVAEELRKSTRRFLESLSESQREYATANFDSMERFNWDFRPLVPWRRDGLRLVNMDNHQLEIWKEILSSLLSDRALIEIQEVLDLETILRDLERESQVANWNIRDPEIYSVAIFGDPFEDSDFMIRFEGHHISLHVTICGSLLAVTPLFLGAYPATYQVADNSARRLFSAEEDLARGILGDLNADQREVAVVATTAPKHLFSYRQRQVDSQTAPRGLSISLMSERQRELLMKLVKHYMTRISPEAYETRWRRVVEDSDSLSFAWAGSDVVGAPHYYAVGGSEFLLEYDKTQDGGNHVHTVWREFAGDWGEDILRRHYAQSHTRTTNTPGTEDLGA